jgi:hypothetical protein
MSLIADRLHRAWLDPGEVAWLVPAMLLALLLAGAVASVFAGYPAADMIGADGMASLFLMVP